MRKKADPAQARAAVDAIADWIADPENTAEVPRTAVATAVRQTARLLEGDAPGHSVEVRVPPFVAVQCIDGPEHTRGTPPNVVELKPLTWLRAATGHCDFVQAADAEGSWVSGQRAGEVARFLPVIPLAPR